MTSTGDDPFRDFGAATPAEVQRAHDVLHAIVCGDVVVPIQPDNFRLLHATHDTLAWVLGFECGESFRKVVTCAVRTMKSDGVKVWLNPPPV